MIAVSHRRAPAARWPRLHESDFDGGRSPDAARPDARRRWPALAADRVAAAPAVARPTAAPVAAHAVTAFVEPEEYERWDGMA